MPIETYATLYKQPSIPSACLGTTVTYTVTIENINMHPLTDVMFTGTIPNGLDFVPDSVEIDGDLHPGYHPGQGFPLPTMIPTRVIEVKFSAEATLVPTDNPAINIAHINFNTRSPEDFPVNDETVYSNAAEVVIKDCACDEDSCEQSVCKIYSISLPFTVKPFARKDTPNIICLDGMTLSPGHVLCPSPQRDFDYTLTQRIKVELPVAFGAEVCYEEPCTEDDGECDVTP